MGTLSINSKLAGKCTEMYKMLEDTLNYISSVEFDMMKTENKKYSVFNLIAMLYSNEMNQSKYKMNQSLPFAMVSKASEYSPQYSISFKNIWVSVVNNNSYGNSLGIIIKKDELLVSFFILKAAEEISLQEISSSAEEEIPGLLLVDEFMDLFKKTMDFNMLVDKLILPGEHDNLLNEIISKYKDNDELLWLLAMSCHEEKQKLIIMKMYENGCEINTDKVKSIFTKINEVENEEGLVWSHYHTYATADAIKADYIKKTNFIDFVNILSIKNKLEKEMTISNIKTVRNKI